MSNLLTLTEGTILTKFARQAIEAYIQETRQLELPKTDSEALHEHRSVFVTLKKRRSSGENHWMLRGCIGRLQSGSDSRGPPISLLEATRQAALSSAFEDPRFPPIRDEELDSIIVEVSVLTVPDELTVNNRTNLAEQISIGKDGLLIEGKGWYRGLLLPQVAIEQGWNAEQFLQGCCQKAGLPPECYLSSDAKIFKFQAQIFAETRSKGEIVQRTF